MPPGNPQVNTLCYSTSENRLTGFVATWTNQRNRIAGNSNLERVGFLRNLHHCVVTSPATPFVSGRMMATVVGAVIGAAYLEGCVQAVDQLLQTLGLNNDLAAPVMLNPPPVNLVGLVVY